MTHENECPRPKGEQGKFHPGNRDEVIEFLCSGFVSPSAANKKIYRMMLETLWPEGSYLPGPVVTREQLREAVNAERRREEKPDYLDVFRRLRELQGEEGLLGIEKVGSSYRMEHADVATQRVPRRPFSASELVEIEERAGGRCSACGVANAAMSPDHRIPRSRGGGDGAENIQLLCQSCNILKSVACRGCREECLECPWYDPASYPIVTIRGSLSRLLASAAAHRQTTAQALVEKLVREELGTNIDAEEDSKGILGP